MKSAKEAFEATMEALEEVSVIDETLEIERKIDEQIEKKQFGIVVGPYSIPVAEKLSVDFEERGFNVSIGGGTIQNGDVVVQLGVSWKIKPSTLSRIDSSLADL